ncbi:DUF2332 domain-containing protein [Roseateles sp. DAIF2]|uniref:DUF2332 domain-containing protein n=1 Tax=Roseateles sp. DAIF2 TaxID=2714952 RepID=UPI0018A33506|nr:DUF2332 domain-containing protein [Roseateles sp. DAIF2]QPF71782.1 DUF2332 domain-containing protein [Roseateles sp. DAIF2]
MDEQRPEDDTALQAWAAQYRHFAAFECPQDPLYVAICEAIAGLPELLTLMAAAPATQRRPNLLLAALQDQLLAGEEAHSLADYYPSLGGARAPDAELPALLLDFVRRRRTALTELLATRSTQTNECGRCAVLWPALQAVAAATGGQDLALLDIGSSAGLTLGVDRYRYDYGRFQRGAPAGPELPTIACDWLGEAPPPAEAPAWRLVERAGLDPAPVDLQDEAAVRWLRACLWPHDRERARRFEQAVALARAEGPAVRRADDCLAAIEPWLDALAPGVQPVLFNSWVLAYFDPAALADYQARLLRLVRERGIAWLCAESPALHGAGLAAPPAPPADPGAATLWSLSWAAPTAALQRRALAWSHPHGRWLQWLER